MSSPEQTFSLEKFKTTTLLVHNAFRDGHQQVAALTQDTALDTASQTWAEHLLSTGNLEHDHNRGDVGENLYYFKRSLPPDPPWTPEQIAFLEQHYPHIPIPVPFTGPGLASDAVSTWYREIKDYSYITTKSTNGNPIGHFTQVVWKASLKLGCGAAWKVVQENGSDCVEAYVVCRYAPQGNFVVLQPGESYDSARVRCYSENVHETKSGWVKPEREELIP